MKVPPERLKQLVGAVFAAAGCRPAEHERLFIVAFSRKVIR
jgi:hypothetical protein